MKDVVHISMTEVHLVHVISLSEEKNSNINGLKTVACYKKESNPNPKDMQQSWISLNSKETLDSQMVNLIIIFLSQMTLLRLLNFLLGSLTVTLTVLLFWIYFFLLMLVFVLQWLSLHWEILIMFLSQILSTFQ